MLSLALHLAAGFVLAVVGLELMPEALTASPAWVPILAFVAGAALFMLLDRTMRLVQARLDVGEEASGPLAVFSGGCRLHAPEERHDDRLARRSMPAVH